MPILRTYGNPQRWRALVLKVLRHHADYGKRTIIEIDGPAHDVRVAGELALPETMAENGHRACAHLVVIRGKRTTEQRRHAHHLEIVGPNQASIQFKWLVYSHHG